MHVLKLCIVLIKVMSYELRSVLRLKHCVSHRAGGVMGAGGERGTIQTSLDHRVWEKGCIL